ncbi:PIN domain-like protein [Lindgomyces ingoldianus]|uniref:PIN domain-like protein n=1 Tax=Lindgomyces ingoldianus TaxID=673940 RepID=A0ACB6RBJ3_9PLEO|nr:PIN domain-like protein [Lindgomyces ingoldianus]KAF2476551.1 PIN domain-like protein [Lindgomyces ingoldianus]
MDMVRNGRLVGFGLVCCRSIKAFGMLFLSVLIIPEIDIQFASILRESGIFKLLAEEDLTFNQDSPEMSAKKDQKGKELSRPGIEPGTFRLQLPITAERDQPTTPSRVCFVEENQLIFCIYSQRIMLFPYKVKSDFNPHPEKKGAVVPAHPLTPRRRAFTNSSRNLAHLHWTSSSTMGVTGLWTVLQPCARPIKIETLNKKRLAVDASIWIYQFLKAVRDKEGNALRNSHIVGFFRRICKLLFFGIKPVFVFDGGAPALKRQTITNRKSRREGRREDAVRTAGKLLALQMQRAAEEEEKKRKEAARRPTRDEPDEEIPEDVVYAEEILQTQKERQQNRKFKKNDQYHLPDLGVPLAEMGGQNDPRIMSLEELEEYARHFDRGEDINVYDFSKIDFDSAFFVSLPASDRYNILNAARLRSRLRMGYSKDQLDTMFPDRMAFSKFQIERVRERNELTQRLMNLNGMNDDAMWGINGTNRVAGEKSREYVLVKNDGVEGGWALGVVTNKDEGQSVNKPIDVDRLSRPDAEDEGWEDDEDDFEDVPIEGLNRLPKQKPSLTAQDKEGREFISKELAKRRQKLYASRKAGSEQSKPNRAKPINQDPDSLFLAEEDGDGEWENVPIHGVDNLLEEPKEDKIDEEEEQLQQAIALSLQQGVSEPAEEPDEEEEEDILQEVFQQERVKETSPFSSAKGSGLAIARLANQRSSKLVPAGPFNTSDSEDDDMDLQAALAQSRKSKRPTTMPRPVPESPAAQTLPNPHPARRPTNAPGFDGPLPFEKLNLGNSILGKKKIKKIEQSTSGGFERDLGQKKKKKSAEPLPPWFTGDRDIQRDLDTMREEEMRAQERDRETDEVHAQFQFQEIPLLRKQDPRDVIDLEASTQEKPKEVLTIESDSNEEEMEMEDVLEGDPKLRMGDHVSKVRIEPPQLLSEGQRSPPKQGIILNEVAPAQESDEEPIEWSESEPELEKPSHVQPNHTKEIDNIVSRPFKSASPAPEDAPIASKAPARPQPSKSPSPEFEDVPIQAERPTRHPRREPSPAPLEGPEDLTAPVPPLSGIADDNAPDYPDNDSDQYSDPEDAELFASLAAEATEHARFAQELNNNQAAPISFDEELKQLRLQQKKDRRDADEVTQTMISECQHLLTLFGLPYITAPMEAEAQCAELVRLGLVDGIVTDDSDTFLFGGTRVYKNMFNAAKFVECYLAADLTSEFSLTREKLIAIAQLLGSDYTTGIPGIGPVTALEILSEFTDLTDFKEWWTGVQNNIISKDADKSSQFRRRFRRTQSTKLFLPATFPDPRVADAYLHPDVDDDPQPFQWGVPDLNALRTFLSGQIGWSWERTDEVLVPVIRDMNRREKEGTQSNITRYFDGAVGAGAFAPRVRKDAMGGEGDGRRKGKGAAGKRLGAALTRLAERERGVGVRGDGEEHAVGGGGGEGVDEAAPSNGLGKRKKRKAGRRAMPVPGAAPGDMGSEGEDEDAAEEDDLYNEPRRKARKTKKRNPHS